MDPEVRYAATADGVSIAYRILGNGPPLLVLPYLPLSHLQAEWQIQGYRNFLERLGEQRTVIRYDPRGVGLSDRNCSDFSLEAHVSDIIAVLDKLGIEKCSVFAASYAGPIGIALAARCPERVDRLLLWCTHASFAEVAAEVSDDRRQQRAAVIGLARVDPALAVQTYIHDATGWGSGEDTSGYARVAMKSIDAAEFFARLDAYAAFDASGHLGAVRAPTLVLHRPAFHGSSVAVARRLAARLPEARLLLLDGASVAPFSGNVEAVLRGIDEFLGPGAPGSVRAEPPAQKRAAPEAMQALLFTDIEGYTGIMQRLGDDRGRDLLREHEDITRAALRAHGGREVKTLGDGFIASFASVRGALECAIALQQRLAAANANRGSAIGAASLAGSPLNVRIGLNAGEPVSEDDDLFGSSVIAVSRIAGQAAGGQILVSDVVRQLAAGKQFIFKERGTLALEGYQEPMRLHEVCWKDEDAREESAPSRHVTEPEPAGPVEHAGGNTTPPPPERSPLVGRHAERSLIESAVRAVCGGSGSLVLMTGDTGLGKTRLLEEAAAIARSAGAVVAWGRCDPGSFAPPMWPWIQVLRDLEQSLPGIKVEADPGTRATIARMIGEGGNGAESIAAGDSDQGRFRLFDAAERYLRRIAATRPLVVILDDLEHADLLSLSLLEFIAGRVRDERVLLVAAAHDFEATPGSPLARTLGQLVRLPATTRVALRPLADDDIGALLRSVMVHSPAAETVERIAGETGGNPLFAVQVARLLDTPADGRTAEPTPRVPEGIREVVLQRYNRLPGISQRLLEYAAVAGREFDLPTLQRIPELAGDPGAVLDALEPAETFGIVEAVPGTYGAYRFSQTLIRDAIYEGIPSARRARTHLALGEALQSGRGHDRFDHLSRIARHFMQGVAAGGAARACEASTRAGNEAFAVSAYDRAVQGYTDALSAHELAGGSDDQRGLLLLSLAEARTRAGDVRGGKQSFREAAEIAQTLGDAEMLAKAALGYGEFVEAGVRDPLRVALVEQALAALPNTDSPLRARLFGLLGEALARTGSRQKRLEVSRLGVEMARRLDDPSTLAFTLNTRHWALWDTNQFDERLSAAEEMLRLARSAGDDALELKARRWRIVNALEIGDPVAIEAEVRAYEALAQRLREAVQLWRAATMQIGLEILRANWSAAEEAMEVAIARGEQVRSRGLARFFGMQRFVIERSRGRLPEIESELDAAVGRLPALTDLRVLLAVACLASGKSDAARAHYEGIWNEIVSRPVERLGLPGACLLAELCAELGDTGRASMLESNLVPHAERNAIFGESALVLGPTTRFLGLLAEQQRRPADAIEHFEDALERAHRLRAPYLVAELEVDLARCLMRDGKGDERASSLLADAVVLAERHGFEGLCDSIAALRAASSMPIAPRRPRPESLPAGLSAREAEVLTLLARGLTNKETADELVLSVRTVERHIANIYTKIDAHSRAEATAFALRHGLG